MARFRNPASLALAALVTAGAQAQPQDAETTARIQFIEKVARFVDWPWVPPQPAGVFHIAVLGRSPFGDALDLHFATRDTKGLAVSVRYIQRLSELRECDLLFISDSESQGLEATLAALRLRPILTMASTPGFARRGVMVNLVRSGDRMAFELNLQSSRTARINLHPGLVRLAKESF